MKRYFRSIALFLMISLMGCSGTFLLGAQIFAWTKMTANFLKQDAPILAVSKAFDGKHPCKLCKHLREMRAKQSSHPLPAENNSRANECLGFDRPTEILTLAFQPQATDSRWQNTHYFADARLESPPLPPPRA